MLNDHNLERFMSIESPNLDFKAFEINSTQEQTAVNETELHT